MSTEPLYIEVFQYYNHKRITVKLKGMSPLQYRTHAQRSYLNSLV
ncbi:hypothetical protein CN535_30265 [Bacillus pseudomycoides]|nr:hypothetical protein COO16_26075 [Bacillus pseudomycoides]PEU24082.1 hypothetical protein CN535_30265 [Bacillus pseudomycoides]PFY10081.1 hypothetical protein COL42_25750 [Bacillus pseudomycoides]PGA70088.1 hypothetical protein COL89_17865 [Bacillus pseudomycoides]